MSNLLAGLGKSQLADLPRRIAAKRQHFEAYSAAFSGLQAVEMMPISVEGDSNYWLSCLLLADACLRDSLLAALAQADIEARPLWKPLHLQPVYAGRTVYGSALSEDLFARGLCLPSGSSLSDTERARVVDCVHACVAEAKRGSD